MTPDTESDLRTRLRRLGDAQRALQPSAQVEHRVMAAWDARAGVEVRRGVGWHWLAAAATATAAVIALGVSGPRGSSSPDLDSAPAIYRAGGGDVDQYLRWLDDDPASLTVVRLRGTPALLSTMGVSYMPASDLAVVEVEVVIGPDGAPRGARLVPQLEAY